MADSVDLDQMLPSVASNLVLHCLFGPLCPNTEGKYDIPMLVVSLVNPWPAE